MNALHPDATSPGEALGVLEWLWSTGNRNEMSDAVYAMGGDPLGASSERVGQGRQRGTNKISTVPLDSWDRMSQNDTDRTSQDGKDPTVRTPKDVTDAEVAVLQVLWEARLRRRIRELTEVLYSLRC